MAGVDELDPPPDELFEDDELPPQADIPAANSPVIARAIRLRLTLIGLCLLWFVKRGAPRPNEL
jgi:hypothetical protein